MKRRIIGPVLLDTMDRVPGVRLTEVDLPTAPPPPSISRTLQGDVHPNLTRAFEESDRVLRVAEIPDGVVIGSGGVLTPDGALVLESLWDDEHLRRDFTPMPKVGPRTRLPGRCASLISLWCDNYFHWIFNSLPRLAVLAASGVQYDSLIVPAPLKPFMRDTLELLGIGPERLVPFTGEHVQPELLVWAAPLSPINTPTAFMLESVRTTLGQAGVAPVRKLYVSRGAGTRRVVNEAEIWAALEPLGFEFMLPDRLPFREQARTFAEARVVVGPHGANLAGGVFSTGLSVVEFFQPAHVNPSIKAALCGVGADHWSVICPPVRRMRPGRGHDDMQVPLDVVLRTLEAIDRERAVTGAERR